MKHTPGPWRWSRERIGNTWHAFLRSTQPVETLRHYDPLVTAMREDLAAFPYAINTADTLLMAAAPTLLEACEYAERIFRRGPDSTPAEECEALAQLRAAIALTEKAQ